MSSYRLSPLLLAAALAAAAPAYAQTAVGRDSVAALMNAGYDRARSGDRAGAIEQFVRAVESDTANASARRELAYLLLGAERKREASAHFEALVRQGGATPRDRLQLGYLQSDAGRPTAARQNFRAATASPDSAIANPARRALDVVAASAGAAGDYWSELYAAPVFQSRFSNVVAPLILRSGVVLADRGRFSAYTSLRGTRDTRSRGGAQPVIFSDNVVVPALGLSLRPFGTAFTLYAEGGAALPLVQSRTNPTRADMRAGAVLGGRFGDNEKEGVALFTDIYADASWYSRFDDDVIAYAQLRESMRVLSRRATSLELFGQLNGVVDSRSVSYNNIGEASVGAAFTPWRPLGVTLRAEYVRGRYLRDPGAELERNYDDVRISAVVGKYFVRARRD